MTERKFKSRKKNPAVRAVCKICGTTLYSLTKNYNGQIICPKCDRDLNQKY